LRRIIVAVGLVALLATTGVTLAVAANPGNGQSTGEGTVFFPNPVAQLQDQSLTDQKDADYAALAPAYRQVQLTNLDGSGRLVGDYANIVSETGDPAYSPTNTFHYRRNDDRFEQVMAYYWVTEAQKYIQSLGFGSTLRPVNRESQDVRINQWGQDNSFSWDKKDMIKLGKGGVDDAEDAEVILHELGHAIQDSQQSPFGYGFGFEARSIGEGFADYWAVTVSNVIAPTPDAPCVADWDSVSYTSTVPHCLRRTDLNLH
jgi:zinc metalloprotease ZmpB